MVTNKLAIQAVDTATRENADSHASDTLPTPRVSVVIPALNEARNLVHVFARLPHDLFEVVLVDGHSYDNTVEVARALYPDVRVVHQTGRGKGNALACGFKACRGDIIVMLDADGSADPREIPAFVATLLAGADFAKGSRFLPGGGSTDITRLRRLGNRSLNTVVNILYGTHYSDLCYGYNAFWSRCLPHLHVDCDGFEVETLINVRTARARLRVAEVPSYEAPRLYGVSNLHAFRDGWRVLMTILFERVQPSLVDNRSGLPLPGTTFWDGMERRSGTDRRGGADLQQGSGTSQGRRSGSGRRVADPLPAGVAPSQPIIRPGLPA